MELRLQQFSKQDLPLHQQWCLDIEATQYMSRTAPHDYLLGGLFQSALMCWFLILVDDQPLGAIWFEKEKKTDNTVTLGILIGNKKYFGQGLGEQAILIGIQAAINQLTFDHIILNVRKSNQRAIRCYTKCGFKIIKEGTKKRDGQETVPYLEMCLQLPMDQNQS